MRTSWDRGTVVVHGIAPDIELPGVVWDPRTGSHRAPAWRHSEILQAARTRGLDIEDGVLRKTPAPPAVESPELRPYQAAAVAAWRRAGQRGILVLPTGAGKTRTAISAIVAARRRTLILVPTRVLLNQWVSALAAAGYPPALIGRYGDGVRDEQPITVCTYASARVHMHHLGNRFGLLVVDECHHFGNDHGDEILELCAAPGRLGLTATLPEDVDRRTRLARVVGEPVFESTVDELAGTWLAPYDLSTLTLTLTQEERRAYDLAVGRYRPYVQDFFRASPGATWPQLVASAMRTQAGRAALDAWRTSRKITAFASAKIASVRELLARHRGQRLLAFTGDNRAAYTIARELLVMPITCDIGRKERDRVLAWFAEGRLTALVSARVLNEGVDVPAAAVAVLVSGSQGSREYVQRVGRVLRPEEGKRALIYELVVANTHEARQAERGRRRLAGEAPAAVSPRG